MGTMPHKTKQMDEHPSIKKVFVNISSGKYKYVG